MGHDFEHKGEDQMVVAKFFDPMGSWKWYLMNINPEFDPNSTDLHAREDYAWGIVKGNYVETGSFSMVELQTLVLPFGMGIERDTSFRPMTATDVWSQLNADIHI
jgi:hypothetical protein